MADENTPGAEAQDQEQPSLNIVGQYIRDLSFENPGAPASIIMGNGNPDFSLNINVGVTKQGDDLYAVELNISAKAERESKVLFNVELVYGGLFRVRGISDSDLGVLLMIECPRLIFPFARQTLANITQSGGFPPLLMEPVDFVALYRQNLEAMAQQQNAADAPVQN